MAMDVVTLIQISAPSRGDFFGDEIQTCGPSAFSSYLSSLSLRNLRLSMFGLLWKMEIFMSVGAAKRVLLGSEGIPTVS